MTREDSAGRSSASASDRRRADRPSSVSAAGSGRPNWGLVGSVASALRVLAGVLAGGLVMLALVLVVAAVLAGNAGAPGPGIVVLAGHVLAAVGAVAAQRVADRDSGARTIVAALGVVLITAVVLGLFWLA